MNSTAFIGGTVVDVVNKQYRRDQVIVVEDGRITTVGPAGTAHVPPEADRRVARGRWITPGLIDMHCHLTPLSDDIPLELLLANGVTTVRDPGGPATEQRLIRESVLEGRRPGPRIIASGEILDGNPPAGIRGRILVDTPERGIAAVRHLAAQGMDCIKIYNHVPEEVMSAIVVVASELGLPVIGHVPRCMSMLRAIELGLTGLEHIRITGLDFLPADQARDLDWLPLGEREPRLWELIDLDASWVDTLIAAMISHDVSLDPTLIVDDVIYTDGLEGQRTHPDNRYLPPATYSKWVAYPSSSGFQIPGHLRNAAEHGLRKRREFVGRCADAGVRILTGTDGAALGRLLPGFSLHHELGLLKECGISAYQALAAATINAAQALGMADMIGSIEPGMLADIAVWTADPLSTRLRPSDLEVVMARGICHDPDVLLDCLR